MLNGFLELGDGIGSIALLPRMVHPKKEIKIKENHCIYLKKKKLEEKWYTFVHGHKYLSECTGKRPTRTQASFCERE